MRSSRLILLLLLLLALGAVWIVAQILHDGLSAKAHPTKLETAIARRLRNLAIPRNAREQRNPVAPSPETLHEAMLHFADHCAVCHANDGNGDSLYGRGLYPKPPDLRRSATQNLSDGQLFWIIENGVRFTGMPAFGFRQPGGEPSVVDNHAHDAHGDAAASWKLVHFIRHLPQLTPAERMEMERNNPKSPQERAEEEQEEKFLQGETSAPGKESNHKRHR